jgi:FkbM family methyltransferase
MHTPPQATNIILEALHRISAERFGREGHLINGLHAFDHIVGNPGKYNQVFDTLEDAESREILAWLIEYRIAYYLEQSRERALELFPPQLSTECWADLVARASTHPASGLEANLDVDIIENWLLDGYSFPGECEVAEGDTVFDCGAFNGNSTIVLGRKAGPTGFVYAFEPNPEMSPILTRNLVASNCDNVEIVKVALMDHPDTVRFNQNGAASRPMDFGGIEVTAITLDQFVQERELRRVDFLKFDIEGFELPALKGASATIRRFRPKMAISVYHLHYDITDIPLYIKQICRWYRLFLRHNAPHDGEIVLYACPVERISPGFRGQQHVPPPMLGQR